MPSSKAKRRGDKRDRWGEAPPELLEVLEQIEREPCMDVIGLTGGLPAA